jgi:predicted tellurium resistance membrane protein TerC
MVADFVMSLDNVLAIAAAAEGDIAVIILGIALSIPIIVWGSALVMRLLTQYPVLVYLGAGILGYTAGEMFVSDKAVYGFIFGSTPTWIIPAVTTALVIAAGQWKKLMNTPKSA